MSDDKRLVRIEDKLDKVIEQYGNRITKLEAEQGFIRAGFLFCLTLVTGAIGWAFKKAVG